MSNELANQMGKGNCCGGFNSLNEDYMWSKYANGYPKFQVQAIDPKCFSSNRDYDGIVLNRGVTILDGVVFFSKGLSNAKLETLADDGSTVTINIFPAVTPEYKGKFVKITLSQANEDDPVGWEFNGWQVTMLCQPLVPAWEIEFTKQVAVAMDWPAGTAFTAGNALERVSNVAIVTDSTITTYNGKVATISFKLPAVDLGAGAYYASTVADVQKIMQINTGSITVTSVTNVGSDLLIVCEINVAANASVKVFYECGVEVFNNSTKDCLIGGLQVNMPGGQNVNTTVTNMLVPTQSERGSCLSLAIIPATYFRYFTQNNEVTDVVYASVVGIHASLPLIIVAAGQPLTAAVSNKGHFGFIDADVRTVTPPVARYQMTDAPI